MRVLLLGATGNLGSRCVAALVAHHHVLTIYVRNTSKLKALMSPALLELVDSIVEGDATDASTLAQTIREHNIEAIIDVAGNQVLPWKEYVLDKIAKAASDAAVIVGKERGKALRMWATTSIQILQVPGTDYLMQDYMGPKILMAQHEATRAVMEAIPLQDLKWTILAISWMHPANRKQGLFEPTTALRENGILASATYPPAWKSHWISMVPVIGHFLNFIRAGIWEYATRLESVADFLAEDLESGSERWVGKKVGVKQDWSKKIV